MTQAALLFGTCNLAEPIGVVSKRKYFNVEFMKKLCGRITTKVLENLEQGLGTSIRELCFLRKFLDATVGSMDSYLPKLS